MTKDSPLNKLKYQFTYKVIYRVTGWNAPKISQSTFCFSLSIQKFFFTYIQKSLINISQNLTKNQNEYIVDDRQGVWEELIHCNSALSEGCSWFQIVATHKSLLLLHSSHPRNLPMWNNPQVYSLIISLEMGRTARERSIILQSCIEMFLFIFTRKALKLKSPLQTLLIEGYIIIAHLSISSTKKKKRKNLCPREHSLVPVSCSPSWDITVQYLSDPACLPWKLH